MAGIRASSLLFFSLLLLAAIANPRAHATLIVSAPTGISASGQLCCTQNGNCPGAGVPGALVTLRCSTSTLGPLTVVGLNTTDNNGFFNITVPGARFAFSGLSSTIPCLATVQLPAGGAACPVLSTSAVLNGVLGSAVTVLTQAFGLIRVTRVVFFVKLGF